MPVRRRLFLLTFSLLMPAVIACAIAVVFSYAHERERSEENLLHTTQALAQSMDVELDVVVRQMEALATSPSLQTGDLAAFWGQASRAVRTDGMWIVLMDLEGRQLVNTLRGFGEPLPRHAAGSPPFDAVKRVAETKNAAVTDLFFGPVTRRPTLAVMVPVFGADDKVIYGLAMGVDPAALQKLAHPPGVPASWLLAAFDTNGTIVARSLDSENAIGQRPVRPLLAAMKTSADGILDAATREGVDTRVAFSRSPKYGWHFAIGVPMKELTASVYKTILLFLAVAVLLLAAGVALAANIGRDISRAITALVPAAHRLGGGQRVEVDETGVLEVDEVAAALGEAADALLTAKEETERANLAKSQFLASASHDLRQPVQSLFFFQEVLATKLKGHPAAPLVASMQSGMDALKMLLDGLLDISRLHAGVVEILISVFPVATLLDRLVAEYRPAAEARGIILRYVPSTAWVRSDLSQLERILRNFLDNAIKYTGSGATVLLGCRHRGDDLGIEVVDTGPGIPADKLDTVFDEFVQLGNPERDRAKGLGLGLAIVRHLGRLLGHPISVRSTAGRGSVFSVVVPVTKPRRAATPLSARVNEARELAFRGNGLALVVEDEALVLLGLRSMLEGWGWEVLAADSGDDAVGLVSGSSRAPDIIVADYRLRGDETGVKVIRDVHGVCGLSIPAVVLTGDTSPDRLAECKQSGFFLVHKPVDAATLKAAIEEMKGRLSA
ncbi:MAG: ATP-binding protein [Solirubrobacterales bacterium]